MTEWFSRTKAWFTKAATSREAEDVLEKLRRALELQTLDRPQAEVNSTQATAVAGLVSSLQGTPQALIQIGSLLIVKVNDVPIVVTLSQRQLLHMESHPSLFRDPCAALDKLQEIQEIGESSGNQENHGLSPT